MWVIPMDLEGSFFGDGRGEGELWEMAGAGQRTRPHKSGELWGAWMAGHSLTAPPSHPRRGRHFHAWHLAGVKKEELCEKLPLKEGVSLGVIQGQGVSGSEEGRGLKRGRQDSGKGRALMTLGPQA